MLVNETHRSKNILLFYLSISSGSLGSGFLTFQKDGRSLDGSKPKVNAIGEQGTGIISISGWFESTRSWLEATTGESGATASQGSMRNEIYVQVALMNVRERGDQQGAKILRVACGMRIYFDRPGCIWNYSHAYSSNKSEQK